ncbi:MAG: hypothetical protein JRD49_10155 [Deltaproteobacteria bacterium]|nr:hypothetical protein [Deltaproteobacteria bacterium]MBW2632993.1 hypothetical protein [Deltaproteobacteria bacterium]MBW2677920.1 hypothetical protein [Deltaproteobacteria bacterium]
MRIRHATEADFSEIAAVHIQSWRDAYSGVLPAEFLGGTRTNRVVKNIFDYQVPSWQIDWKDLSRVVSSQDHFI